MGFRFPSAQTLTDDGPLTVGVLCGWLTPGDNPMNVKQFMATSTRDGFNPPVPGSPGDRREAGPDPEPASSAFRLVVTAVLRPLRQR
ncbi:hypothetical protein Axi01nite_80820 [Actinoplanes xinjiangensis]|nr:hypothetical protein Axi01nite_80820 [Actinoplanes xinjiangensis]